MQRLGSLAIREVEIGMGGVELFAPADLAAEQVGYAVTPAGADLCSGRPGDWQRAWIVFGRETLCGDPLFVDAADPQYPVFTAMHGAGTWKPDLISDSLSAFAATMVEIARLSRGREGDELDDNPLSRSEQSSLKKTLKRLSPKADPDFWLNLFTVD